MIIASGTVAKLAMRQPFVLFKGLTFQKLCLPGCAAHSEYNHTSDNALSTAPVWH
ncbi:hypothetical protein YN33_004644 [Salmonella enterica subsp. enterica]|nr:hypothetical protein [Salmonella enterica subsp. enterica]